MEHVLGVMTNRIKDPNSFLPYHRVSSEEGFDRVLVFRPEDVRIEKKMIKGYTYEDGEWTKVTVGYPTITYDIGYYAAQKTVSKVRKLKKLSSLPFVNYGLGTKWKIHQRLLTIPELHPHLIPTKLIESGKKALAMLEEYQTIVIKPINGKEGKGIVKLSANPAGFLWEEDLNKEELATPDEVEHRVNKLLQHGRYIGQKWINIKNKVGITYDIRSLMQKDGHGEWVLTGMAVRQGAEGKVTSNLMDGGKPFAVVPYLRTQFGKRQTRMIYEKLKSLSMAIPPHIEMAYQNRQAELGLDLAIDQAGGIYIIEINIKPGKIPFKEVFGIYTKEASIRTPIQYASFLVENGMEENILLEHFGKQEEERQKTRRRRT